MSNIFNKDNATIEDKKYFYKCEVKDCGERARICTNSYDYVSLLGKGSNNFYMCVEHFTKLRHLMQPDKDRIKERYEFEQNFMKRFKIGK